MAPRPAAMALACILLSASVATASADGDHDRARDAVKAGRILPLERIVARAEERFGGKVLDVDLEDEHDTLRYELKLMGPDGRILRLVYDAASGELLDARGRGRGGERRRDGSRPEKR